MDKWRIFTHVKVKNDAHYSGLLLAEFGPDIEAYLRVEGHCLSQWRKENERRIWEFTEDLNDND